MKLTPDGEKDESTLNCYSYTNGAWNHHKMPEAMAFGSYSSNPRQMGIGRVIAVGGRSVCGDKIEILTPDGWKISRATLPNYLESSCTVFINDTTIIIMGGFWYENGSQYTTQTFFYDVECDILSPGPALKVARSLSSCSIMEDTITGDKSVVISGGSNQSGILVSTEILDLKTGVWSMGPNIPLPIYAANMLEHPNGGVVLVGGYTNELYQQNIFHLPSATGAWMTLPQVLKNRSAYSVAFLLEDDSKITTCKTKGFLI